jgi:protein-disulfide isomerase/peroxiredoxin
VTNKKKSSKKSNKKLAAAPAASPLLPALFTLVALLCTGWAWFLIGLHYDAVAAANSVGEPAAAGGATSFFICGEGQACSQVLADEAAELFGVIPVSIPAIPMFGLLALLGVAVLRGRFSRERLASLATFCGLGGLAFGAYLLSVMLLHYGPCRFCLVMDSGTLLVFGLGAAMHPGGFGAALRSLPDLLGRLKTPGPEMALAPLVLIGSLAIHGITSPGDLTETVATEAAGNRATTDESARALTTTAPESEAVSGSIEAPGTSTRRVVLQAQRKDIPIDASVPTRGPKNAAVTLVLFEDFQCPYCKKLSGNIEQLLEDEDIAKDTRIAFMHFPMHKSCNATDLKKSMHKFACSAAAASVCAQEQGRFWEMHDLLFRNNHRLRSGNLKGYAKDIGLDVPKWVGCMRNPATMAKVKRDSKIAGEAGVRGTPSFFINGAMLVGAQPVEAIKAAIAAVKEGRQGQVRLDVEIAGETIGDVSGAATTVTLVGPEGPFTIDAFEASVEGGKATSRAGVVPARNVSWYEASASCKAAGKRLCSEAEWLRACTGAVPIDEDGDGIFSRDLLQGRQQSYGEHYRDGVCADSRKKDSGLALITGNHPDCVSPEGVYDLEGVTKEWIGISPDKAAVKGGSSKSGQAARCAFYKDSDAPDSRSDTTGFRCCSGGDPDASAPADSFAGGKVGDIVQDFGGELHGGGRLSTDQLRGKPFILTFWATWCSPCKKELPALAEAYRKHHKDGLEIVAVNVDRDPAKVGPFLEKMPLPFPVLLDPGKAIMDTFQSRSGGVPLTFWVQADGLIRQRSTGYDPDKKREFAESVQALLP